MGVYTGKAASRILALRQVANALNEPGPILETCIGLLATVERKALVWKVVRIGNTERSSLMY